MRPFLILVIALSLAGCGGGGDDGPLRGGGGDDKLSGTAEGETIEGRGGQDVIEAGGGDDTIDGGPGEDFLYGAEGDDTFVESEDDAVDVHDCGEGEDIVAKPDARDELLPSCETAGWTARPPGEEPYENTVTVQPVIDARSAAFTGTCAKACKGDIELRTPHDRRLLGKGSFTLAAKERGPMQTTLNARGRELVERSGYVRVVIRSEGVNSGFSTFFEG